MRAQDLVSAAKRLPVSGIGLRKSRSKRKSVAMPSRADGILWERVAAPGEMEEGDFSMLALRTADNLRHVRALKKVIPGAAAAAATTIELIMKYPVVTGY